MNSKEKFVRAMRYEEAEIPFDIGANPVTGIHCSVVEELRDYYGLKKQPVRIACPYQMLGVVEDDLAQALGLDAAPAWSSINMFGTRQDAWKEWMTPWGQKVLISSDMEISPAPEGGYLAYPQGDKDVPASGYLPESSFFFDGIERGSNIDEESLEWRDNVAEFEPISDTAISDLVRKLDEIEPEKWAAINPGGTALGDVSLVPGLGLKHPKGIRGVADWYMATMLYPDHIKKIFAHQTEIAIENLKRIAAAATDKADSIYVCGTDFGTQNAPICAPDSYRDLHLPFHKKINDWIHENTNWKTFKHSCGSIEPFIPHFIEAGFDVLNPVQWTASGMDRQTLKDKYRKQIVFWGGGVDTQKTLPFGTPDEVRTEVLETCRIFGKDGGFVFSAIHNIQAKTPVRNVVAMVNALQEYNKG